jgi:hypothetical protein
MKIYAKFRRTRHISAENKDDGFSMVEVLIASGIISTVIVAFIVFLINVAITQRTASLDRTATRIMSSELEKIAGAKWDDLMTPPPGGSVSPCVLTTKVVNGVSGPSRESFQIVQPGPTTITMDALPVSITRSVVWDKTVTQVTNAVGDGTTVTYTLAANNFVDNANTIRQINAGDIVTIYEVYPIAYDIINATVVTATATQFTVASNATGTFVAPGHAGDSVYCTGKKDASDLKVLTVSVAWLDGPKQRFKSTSIYRSKWTEGAKGL